MWIIWHVICLVAAVYMIGTMITLVHEWWTSRIDVTGWTQEEIDEEIKKS